jgi:hypothetical protein
VPGYGRPGGGATVLSLARLNRRSAGISVLVNPPLPPHPPGVTGSFLAWSFFYEGTIGRGGAVMKFRSSDGRWSGGLIRIGLGGKGPGTPYYRGTRDGKFYLNARSTEELEALGIVGRVRIPV